MLNISNTLLSYVDRGLASINTNDQLVKTEQETSASNTFENFNDLMISEEARYALITETQESKEQYREEQLANSIEKSDRQKVQAQDNIDLYIEAAQRYSQQNIIAPAVENRQAISTYSLIENRVLPTNASSNLES